MDIALGEQLGCGMRADGPLACWGRNDNGQFFDLFAIFLHKRRARDGCMLLLSQLLGNFSIRKEPGQ